jgi:hypothetical protein
MKSKIFYAIAAMFVFACDTENENITAPLFLNSYKDHLIFATYANCNSDCIDLFAIQDGKLFSERSRYPLRPNSQRDFVQLSGAQYEIVRNLSESIPNEFLNGGEEGFGIGTAADREVIYVEVKTGGLIRYCVIDATKQGVPEYLHQLVDEIKEKISLLK